MSQALQTVLHDIVEQIKNPITADPEKEIPALVAELVGVMEKQRKWEVKRGDWVPCD